MLNATSAEDWVEYYSNQHECEKSRARTTSWTIPSLRSLGVLPPARVVSVGCGNGIDVVTLRDSGYDAHGVDMHEVEPTARPWCKMGSALNLPFADGEFDAVVSLEVIEHVGVDYDGAGTADRARYATELLRVLRPGGVVIIATPNRYFPIDEHGSGRLLVRFHSPFRDNTLTFDELRQYFPGCDNGTLFYDGYFRFEKLSRLHIPVRPLHLLLRIFRNTRLHRSPLNPHLFAWFRKAIDSQSK
jgi:SAM-dependent methyltransferase